MEAANNPDYNAGLASFDEAFMGHIGYAINRAVRAFTLGLTGGRIASTPVDSQLKNYYRDLEHFSASLAFASDVAMGTLGGALKFKERISARLGDMLSHLYMASAVLKYYEANGATDVDAAHATWALEHHLHEIENALYEVSKNFPVPGVGGLLRTVCLPLGRRFDGPSDALNAKVCEYMMSGQPADNLVQRFGYDMYLNPSEHDPKGILLLAVEKLDAIEPEYEALLKAVKKGDIKAADIDGQLAQAVDQGLFSQAKADAIREYDRLRYEIICTDDFTQEYIKQPLDLVGEHVGEGGLRAAS
jgi:acyl-CoA dehydrogenase